MDKNTLFWTDRWLHGCSIEKLAPTVFAHVSPRICKSHTVADALTNVLGTFKEAYPKLVFENSYSYGNGSWELL
jgi:hypothetical protein